MLLAMDMSMRSSGVVILDNENNLLHFEIIRSKKLDDEGLILYINERVLDLISWYEVDNFVIEGLSFGGKSAKKDLIAGIYWYIRAQIKLHFPEVLIGSIPVTAWRSHLRTKDEWKWFNENCTDPLKNGVFTLLSSEIQTQFILYVVNENLQIKSVFDLTDAYFLGIFRNSLK